MLNVGIWLLFAVFGARIGKGILREFFRVLKGHRGVRVCKGVKVILAFF